MHKCILDTQYVGVYLYIRYFILHKNLCIVKQVQFISLKIKPCFGVKLRCFMYRVILPVHLIRLFHILESVTVTLHNTHEHSVYRTLSDFRVVCTNRIESIRIKTNQTESNRTKSNPTFRAIVQC